jgi:hypothetical protein
MAKSAAKIIRMRLSMAYEACGRCSFGEKIEALPSRALGDDAYPN